MARTVILYSVVMASLIALLKFIEYRYFVRDLSLEFYLDAVVVMFTGLGIWAGLRLTRRKVVVVGPGFTRDEEELKRRGNSHRSEERRPGSNPGPQGAGFFCRRLSGVYAGSALPW